MNWTLFFAAAIFSGCIASPEDLPQAQAGKDTWKPAGMCATLYYPERLIQPADSGATCQDGTQAEAVGFVRRMTGETCGESLALDGFRQIWGCRLGRPPVVKI